MQDRRARLVALAEDCLGGLRGHSILLIGPEEIFQAYKRIFTEYGVKRVFHEKDAGRAARLIPQVQLLVNMPACDGSAALLSAATVAAGREDRHTPLFIFDLAATPSVEEAVGLLPGVCLYTPADLGRLLADRSDARIA